MGITELIMRIIFESLKLNKYWILLNAIGISILLYFSSWFWAPNGYSGYPVGLGDFMAMGTTILPLTLIYICMDLFWLTKIIRALRRNGNLLSLHIFLFVVVAWLLVFYYDHARSFHYYVQ